MPPPSETRPPTGSAASGSAATGSTAADGGRRRDATRTRADLLAAARELFGAHGYARTTLRQIGEHAGADPALIARYFGSKAGLYVASIEADDVVADRPSAERAVDAAFVRRLLERATRLGPSPVLAQVVAPTDDDDIQEAARRILHDRLAEPVSRRLRGAGIDQVELRSEVAVAALAGVALARAGGTLTELAGADLDALAAVTVAVLAPLLDP